MKKQRKEKKEEIPDFLQEMYDFLKPSEEVDNKEPSKNTVDNHILTDSNVKEENKVIC